MYIANEDKVREMQKRDIASKMRDFRTHLFARMASRKGRVGRLGARLDNVQNRLFDRGRGIYKS